MSLVLNEVPIVHCSLSKQLHHILSCGYATDPIGLREVHKRLVYDKSMELQTPDTKSKMKLQFDRTTHTGTQPKKLKFNNDVTKNSDESIAEESTHVLTTPVRGGMRETGGTPATASFFITESERITDDKETLSIMLMHKHDELKRLTTKPAGTEVLGIPFQEIQ